MMDPFRPTAEAACHTDTHGYMTNKMRYLARLEHIEGEARDIHRIVEEEQYGIDILSLDPPAGRVGRDSRMLL